VGYNKVKIVSCLIFLSFFKSFCQVQTLLLDSLDALERGGNYIEIITLIQKTRIDKENKLYGDYVYYKAKAYAKLNKEDSAIHYYQIARSIFHKKGLNGKKAEVNLAIHNLLVSQNNLEDDSNYFNEFFEYAKETNNLKMLAQAYNSLGSKNFENEQPNIPLHYFKRSYQLFDSIKDYKMIVTTLANIGAVMSGRLKKQDSARAYYFQALRLFEERKELANQTNLLNNILNNIGNSYRRDKAYYDALKYYKRAETLQIKEYKNKTRKILFSNMDLTYYYLKDYKNAYKYLYKYDSIKDVISLSDQNASITEIQEKYNNEKLRADNLEIETKRRRNLYLSLTLITLFIIGIIMVFLVHKNTLKKRKLAEQSALLQKQKINTLLKEQELLSIDAMIEGQEKERQRVANELHDDLGSLMVTIKLHFDNVKAPKKDPSLESARALLEKAYQKIRGMAYQKNSGVMSDQGLLQAVKNMAEIISKTNAIEIVVEEYGLGERIENSLELNVFRIIQELVANIIKHAEATKASIHFTKHKDNLNIIVEDNGQGFDRFNLDKSETGLGLHNIEKKIEHLEGNFIVDSIVGKGTSVLIDIPL
jgi:two-component system sensor histidine kinase DegS